MRGTFICLSHDGIALSCSPGNEVDCLRVAICSMMVRCYWCISILIIIPTIRCCLLTGPLCGWSAVVLSDRRYPSFRNFDSTISIDVIRMMSHMDSLFDPTCVPVRVTINKLNFFPNRKMPRFVSVLRNCGGLRTNKPYISVVFFYPVLSRVHYREKTTSELYQQLATAYQQPKETPQQFLLRALDIRNKVSWQAKKQIVK